MPKLLRNAFDLHGFMTSCTIHYRKYLSRVDIINWIVPRVREFVTVQYGLAPDSVRSRALASLLTTDTKEPERKMSFFNWLTPSSLDNNVP